MTLALPKYVVCDQKSAEYKKQIYTDPAISHKCAGIPAKYRQQCFIRRPKWSRRVSQQHQNHGETPQPIELGQLSRERRKRKVATEFRFFEFEEIQIPVLLCRAHNSGRAETQRLLHGLFANFPNSRINNVVMEIDSLVKKYCQRQTRDQIRGGEVHRRQINNSAYGKTDKQVTKNILWLADG